MGRCLHDLTPSDHERGATFHLFKIEFRLCRNLLRQSGFFYRPVSRPPGIQPLSTTFCSFRSVKFVLLLNLLLILVLFDAMVDGIAFLGSFSSLLIATEQKNNLFYTLIL